MGDLETELLEALNADGYNIKHVRSMGVLPDGSEVRGGLREAGEFVKQLLVFSGNELDEDTAKALLHFVFGWLRTRRDSDVAFVTIYGGDNRSVLSTVPVPPAPQIARPHDSPRTD